MILSAAKTKANRSPTGTWLLALVVALVLSTAAAAVAAAADTAGAAGTKAASPPGSPTAAELVSRLSDEEVRRMLLERLAAQPQAAPAGPGVGGMANDMQNWATDLRNGAVEAAAAIPELHATLPAAYERYLGGKPPVHGAYVIGYFVGALLVGLVLEWMLARALAPLRGRLDTVVPNEGLAASSARNLLRFGIDAAGLLAFVVGVMAVFLVLYSGHTPTRFFVFVALGAVVFVRAWAIVSRLLLAPGSPSLRMVPLGDAAARRAHRGLLALAGLAAFTTAFAELLIRFGAPRGTIALWQVGAIVVALVLALRVVWAVRRDYFDPAPPADASGPRQALVADIVAVVLTALLLLIAGTRLVETLGDDPTPSGAAAETIGLLLVLTLLDLALGRVLTALLAHPAAKANETRDAIVQAFEPKLRRAIHIVVGVIGFLAVSRVWDLDLHAMTHRGLGSQITGALLGIGITILVTWLLWELLRTAIDVRMSSENAKATGSGSDLVATRLGTLLPLLRIMLQITVVVMAVLSILSALGVNIVPLLAGAGVVGVAVGFGSQTLVRDIVTGAFFLLDDAFRIGEYIEVGNARGTVEKIRLRAVFLRHHRGALYVLPYGEIKQLRNNSRDYMIMVMEFPLAHGTDLQKVKKIMARVGEELAADDEYGSQLLQPLKSQGVMATEDNALVVRAKFTARPGSAPWVIRRIAYAKILKAFADEGIQFARRQVAVYAAPDARPADVARAAASAAALDEPAKGG